MADAVKHTRHLIRGCAADDALSFGSRLNGVGRAGVIAVMALACAGCGGARIGVRMGELQPGSAAEERAVRADPIGYLREAERRAGVLREYHVTFVRQERLGLVPSLRPAERIAADFRVSPLSVKFVWMDPDSEYRECVFFAGRNDDKVVLLARRGLLGLPAQPAAYDPMDGVRFWRTRNPITDFGVHRMIVRTLKRYDDAAALGGARLTYVGQRMVENTLVRHFEVHYPKADPFPNKRQDLFIEVASGVPVGTNLWLPDGKLDATYLYLDRQVPAAPMADELFTLTKPAGRSRKGKA